MWQFNYPLPKASATIILPTPASDGKTNYKDIWNIGELDFYSPVKFKANRPVEKIELEDGAAKGPVNAPTRRRMYLNMEKNCNGFYANRPGKNTSADLGFGRTNVDINQTTYRGLEVYQNSADFKVRVDSVMVEVQPGFINAGALGEEITSQLHTDNFQLDKESIYSLAAQYTLNSDNKTARIDITPNLQSNTFKCLSTQPILDFYQKGYIDDVTDPQLSWGQTTGNDAIFRPLFYQNLLSPEPNRMKMLSNFFEIAARNPVKEGFNASNSTIHNLKSFNDTLFDPLKYPGITNAMACSNPEINRIKPVDFDAKNSWSLYTGNSNNIVDFSAPYDMIGSFGPYPVLLEAECGNDNTGGTGPQSSGIHTGLTIVYNYNGCFVNIPEFFVLASNIFYNEENFKILQGSGAERSNFTTKANWFDCELIRDENSETMDQYNPQNLNNQQLDRWEFVSSFIQELEIGRTNDQTVNPATFGPDSNVPDMTGTNRRFYKTGLPSYYDAYRTQVPTEAPYDYSDMYANAIAQAQQKVQVYSRWNEYLNPVNGNVIAPIWTTFDLSVSPDLSRKYNMGIVPIRPGDYEGPQDKTFVMGFVVARSYVNPEGTPGPSLNCFNRGAFFGISPSFSDNNCSVPVSAQKTGPFIESGSQKGQYPTGTTMFDYASVINIGANDPQITFNDEYGKFSIKYLHTALMESNGAFSRTSEGEPQNPNPNPKYIPPNNNPTQEIVGVGIDRCDFYLVNDNDASPKTYFDPDTIKTGIGLQRDGFVSSQSGIGLTDLSVDINFLNQFRPNAFKNTLLDKMGFTLPQILSYGGRVNNQFNRGFERELSTPNTTIINMFNRGVSPKTTQGYFTATEIPFMVTNSNDYDMANMGQIIFNQTVSTNSESDEIIAVNLADKLDYPYLVVYSNIIGDNKGQYYGGKGGNSKVPAMAYITRNYAEGDFFYSFSTAWNYTADREYSLTDFETQIRRPDGQPANIDDNSSVIYRITKKQMLPPDILDQEIQEENKNKKKSK